MRSIYSAILLLISGGSCIAQYTCGTPDMDSNVFVNKPWVGNNQFLLDIADSIGYGNTAIPKSASGGFDPMAVYWVPVKAWVYNDDNGTGGIDEAEVEESILRLNRFFAGEINDNGNAHSHTLIQFYLRCNIAYINSSNYAFNPSNSAIDEMWDNHHETAAMNIHYIQNHNALAGRGRFPGPIKSFTCMVRTIDNRHLDGVLPHEVGHALDLLHTHQGRCSGNNSNCGNCLQEAVSRAKIQPVGCGNFSGDKKCEVNGDGLCDTEADPNINFQVEEQAGQFIYTGGGTDNWGDPWNPDVFNVMSYSDPDITERFSTSQIGIMYYWVLGLMHPLVFPSQLHLHIHNEFVDIYEPDNFRHINDINIIGIDETQHRGLHAERFGFKSNPQYGYCDEDWVRYVVPANATQKINVITNAIQDRPQVDTEIFLFASDGTTLLASNDDKAPGDIYSEISGQEVTSGTYWIHIISKGNTAGEYALTVERCGQECCFQPLIGTTTVIDGVTGPFNLGAIEQAYTDYLGNSLDVSSLLAFNSNLPLGFGGAGFPLPSSELDAIICNEAQIQISSGAIMLIGDNPSNRTAQVTFQEGSKLIVNPNAELIVREGSKLIIESGAELRLNGGQVKVYDGGEIIVKEGGLLIYEDGVVLELNGNDAQLALGGHTHIGDDATFQFSWQGTEGGYVRILEEGYWGQRFSAGTNARVRLQGTGKDDLILHMEASADFWEYSADETVDSHPSLSSNRFERVTIQNGKVLMEKSSRIVLLRDGRIFGVHLEKEGPGPSPDGLEPLDHCQVLNSDFYGIPIGAKLHWFDTGQLLINSSNFYQSPVEITGRFYQFNGSYFFQSDVYGEGGTLLSTVSMCEFELSHLLDISTSSLTVHNSHFHGAAEGIEKWYGTLNLKCNEFNDLGFGVVGTAKARVNLSTIHGAGYNKFHDNELRSLLL